MAHTAVSVPLRGVGCFYMSINFSRVFLFPSPCGVWVVSGTGQTVKRNMPRFPSPCGVWVVSRTAAIATGDRGFPSPCGVWVVSRRVQRVGGQGWFPSPCGVWVVSPQTQTKGINEKVSVPLRGVGCFGKAAHSFWCNRKKNCQLCCFIVSYWQMFINSKLRNCKVPCEAHKTAT